MKKISISSRIVVSVFSGLAACALAFGGWLSTPVASADQGNPPTAGTKDASLPAAYQRELKALDRQQTQLNKAKSLIDKIQGQAGATAALGSALDAFKSQLASVQASHDSAAAILSAHAGFDAAGQVTDAGVALKTVKDAQQALRAGQTTFRQAVKDFRAAFSAFRQSHKPAKTKNG
jgi:hypothetical protein